MHHGQGQIAETFWKTEKAAARILCAPELIPLPGQYLLASDASDAPLPVPVFSAGFSADGFLAAPPLPLAWTPGARLQLRGPLGRGFEIPNSARRVALIAFDDSPTRLLSLLLLALQQNAAVTLLCDSALPDLPSEVEVQPLAALADIFAWADYAAFDAARESLSELKSRLGLVKQLKAGDEAQILIRAPMPCGGLAECGVCALTVQHHWKMICKDGPVFDLRAMWD
ncbi:MAG TPA: hypothetical protein VMT73_07405 [Anaerolineales bacterium]|nr:hypothetical protein [Anaerolineales bacterium]